MVASPVALVQVNLQTGFGGGEVYTCFFGQALRALRLTFDLIVHREADWWRRHATGARQVYTVRSAAEIAALPFARPTWIIFHTPVGLAQLTALKAAGCRVAAVVHMPPSGRESGHLRHYDRLFAVSGYVLGQLVEAGLTQTHPEPLYGVAELSRGAGSEVAIVARSPYAWDMRKFRDRSLSWIYPIWQVFRPRRPFTRRAGLTLGIVSRLTPIKQFPVLFAILAPIVARLPSVYIEIFGSGGYASVRDTRRALADLGERVRWWGHQDDVRRIYPLLDYLLTGLPEKEALGLNVIEAQLCGTPVLAPDAPPFSETILHGRTGYRYPDPRTDHGAGFQALLRDLVSGRLPPLDPRSAGEHLARFSEDAFRARVADALESLDPIAALSATAGPDS